MDRIVSPAAATIASVILQKRWPGYIPVAQHIAGGRAEYELEALSKTCPCPHCGYECHKVHARQKRRALDAPLHPHELTWVSCWVRRFRCPRCGKTFTEQPGFIDRRAKVTHAAVYYAQTLIRLPGITLSEARVLTGMSVTTLKKYDKEQLKYCYSELNFENVQNLAIDEFAVFKGRRYCTVVIDNDRCQVLWVGRGKSRRSVQPFFDLLRQKKAADRIVSVACDQNAVYPRLVKENLPHAVIVYDLFHVMAHWHDDVLRPARKKVEQEVRQRIYRQAKDNAQTQGQIPDDEALRRAVNEALRRYRNADWVLITPIANLEQDKRRRYEEALRNILEDNSLLAALYPVADRLRSLWRTKECGFSRSSLREITRLLKAIGSMFAFKPAKKFAAMLERRQEGILQAGHFGFTTNRLEGVNNKIKVIKRKAFGFRDLEYFFLKIKAAFPGKPALSFFNLLTGVAIIHGHPRPVPWFNTLNHAEV